MNNIARRSHALKLWSKANFTAIRRALPLVSCHLMSADVDRRTIEMTTSVPELIGLHLRLVDARGR